METMIWLALLFVTAALLVRWRKQKFAVLKEMGVDGPEPNLIWGNLYEYHSKGRVAALSEWAQIYGDVFGFYNGDVPFLVVKDLDLLKRIFVKDFANFTARGCTMRTDEVHPYIGQSIAHSRGARWQRVRRCVTRGFTSRKLKQMMPDLRYVADTFVGILEEKADSGQEVSVTKLFQGLSMDYAARAMFGIDNSFQKDMENPFMVDAINALPGLMRGFFHWLAHCTTTFGWLMTPVLWLHAKLGTYSLQVFDRHASKLVDIRRSNPSLRRPDMLQSLTDAEDTTHHGFCEESRTGLTPEDVSLSATVLLLGGYEMTATAMSYLTFVVAKHADIQERLRGEVDKTLQESGALDYASTLGLKYMGQVLDETLRMYPPGVTFTTRMAEEDIEYDGIKIRAGTSVMAPTYQIHMDPRYWPEPETFDPERFSPENSASRHPLALIPFGIGPRNCVGLRMARLEMMYTVARMLLEFRLELGDKQKGEMRMGYYAMVSAPRDGPWIKFYKR